MVQITSRITNAAVYALQLKPDTNACCWLSFGEIVAGPVTNDQDVVVPYGNNIYRLRKLAMLPSVPVAQTRPLYFDRGLYLTNYPVAVSGYITNHLPYPPLIKPPTTGVGVR